MAEEEHAIHKVLQFFFCLHLFCELMEGSLRGDRMGTSWLLFILFLCSLFLDYCFPETFVLDLRMKKRGMSNYLCVHFFSFLLFLTPLQTPPKHLLDITMLVCPSWCVF